MIRTCKIDPRSPQPKGDAWRLEFCWRCDGDVIHRWANGSIIACASRHAAVESHHSKLIVPSYHLSISVSGQRASDDVIRGVLADFGLEGAEEDNHSCGNARHFWLDEGRAVQPECECKGTEETVIEPDGYRWQREKAVR
jgi:hypothetical protein